MDALQGALLAQAQRMPGGGAGNVGDALRWFDEPGVNDALVAPERAAGAPLQRGQKPWVAGNRGMPSRPTPPQARRFEVGPGVGGLRAAGYRPGQRLTPRAARELDQQRPLQNGAQQPAREELRGAQEHPNLDLRSFRDYLLQQPKAFSARDPPAPIMDQQPQHPAFARGGFGEHASAEVMTNLGQMYARLTALENSERELQRTVTQQEQEIRAARYEIKDNTKHAQAMGQLEERLRRAEASESAANQRLRMLEETLERGEANSREQQGKLENELRDMQRVIAAAEQRMSDAASQRRELHVDVESVHDKLAERVEKYATALNQQVQRSNEERLKLESSTKSLLHEVSTAVADKLRNVENLLLPELSRKTEQAVTGVQRKLDDGLVKLSAALREVDQLRNQGDTMVRKEVGGVQELVQKGLLQLKAEAEKQKSTVATLVKTEIQNRMLNMDGMGVQLQEMRIDVANEHQAGLQQFSEFKDDVLGQFEVVVAQTNAARLTAEQLRRDIGAEMATLRSEFEASDHGMMLEWRGMMDRQHATMAEKMNALQTAVATESEERQAAVREVVASVIETKDAVESCVTEWRESIDVAETRWDKALRAAVGQLEADALQMQDRLREELQTLEKDQQRVESALKMKIESVEVKTDEKISANTDSLAELNVRMEAVEQLLGEQTSKLEAGLEDCKSDAGAKVLALQEETAEHLSGFRDFLDTELNSIQDTTEKAQEELAEAIASNRTEVKDEMIASVGTQLKELEARVLAAGEAASSTLRDELSSAHRQTAQESQQRVEQGMQQVQRGAQELQDTMMSMRIRITAAEERAMRVQKATQDSVDELATKLVALSTAVATSTDLAELRTSMEAAQLEMINQQLIARRSSTKPHIPPDGGELPTVSQGGLSDDVPEELSAQLSAHLLKLNSRVGEWEDKLQEFQQGHRVSMTRLQERVQRCHGKFDQAKAAVVQVEESLHLVHARLEASNERFQQHEERMTSQDGRADAVDEKISRDEERIDALESADGNFVEQIANLVQRSADLEKGVGKANEAASAADIERALLAENIEKLRTQLESTEKEVGAVGEKAEKASQELAGVEQSVQSVDQKVSAAEERISRDEERTEHLETAVSDLEELLKNSGEAVTAVEELRGALQAVDQKVSAVEEKISRDEERIGHLEDADGSFVEQIANLVQRSGDLEERDRERDSDRASLAKLRAQLELCEKDALDATALGPKLTQLSIRVDHLDRQLQEDVLTLLKKSLLSCHSSYTPIM